MQFGEFYLINEGGTNEFGIQGSAEILGEDDIQDYICCAVGTGGTIAGTISTATQNSITTMTGLVSTGALNSGTIATGFGNIDTGSSTITGKDFKFFT